MTTHRKKPGVTGVRLRPANRDILLTNLTGPEPVAILDDPTGLISKVAVIDREMRRKRGEV